MHGFIKIPEVRQHDRQVMPDVIGPYQQAQAPASAFGQDIARGMGRLSMGLDKLNQQLQFNAQNQNRVQLNEELNLAQNRAAEFENKYMQNNQGANALNTEKDFLAYNQKNREQLLFKYAADPLAKQRINQLFDVNDLAAAQRGLEYANQQSRAYDSQVFEQVLSEVGHTLSDPASSLESRELARIRLQLYWDDTAGRLGLDPEQVHQATDEALHNWELHRAYVYLGQGENNPQRALDDIKQYLQNREQEQDIDSPLSPLSNNELNKACAQLQKQVKRRQTLALQTGGLSLKQLREGIYGLKAQDMIKSAQTINALASGGGLDDEQLAQLQDEADDIGAISELLREDGSFVEKRKRLQDSEQEAGPRKRVKRRLAVLEESEKQFKQDPAQFVRARVDADVDTLMQMGGFAQTMRPMLRAEFSKSIIQELGGQEMGCLLTNEEADQWREQMEEAKTQMEKRALVRQIQQTYGPENGNLVLTQLKQSEEEQMGVTNDVHASSINNNIQLLQATNIRDSDADYDSSSRHQESESSTGQELSRQDPSRPIGIRNNNPGNVRPTGRIADPWQGQTGTENNFAIFDNAENGIRAMGIVIRGSQIRYGNNTITELINAYAPAEDNNPHNANYIRHVARRVGVGENDALDFSNPDTLAAVINAMIEFETGENPYSDEEINIGVEAAIVHEFSGR